MVEALKKKFRGDSSVTVMRKLEVHSLENYGQNSLQTFYTLFSSKS